MNCHHARQLISPYLDGQLTGREMLALGDHLAGCKSCQDEINSLRQIKSLLRGLHTPAPRLEFSRQLSSQEIYAHKMLADSISWKLISLPPRPQRGRRLMSALALSCLTLLALAPASRESRDTTSVVTAGPANAFPASSHIITAAEFVGPGSLPAAAGSGYRFADPPRRGLIVFTQNDLTDRTFPDPPSYSEPSYDPSLTTFSPGTVTLTSFRPR